MNPKTLPRFFSTLLFLLAGLSCAAKTPPPAAVIAQGNNTFSIVIEASSGFSRDTEKLEARAQAEAAKYCADHGKIFKLISLTHEKPWFALGYAKATIVFKALDTAEPEPVAAPAYAPAPSAPAGTSGYAPAPVAAPERPTPTGDLYADLLKLDDLRKKGILTDEEFQSEKKKVLDRSK